MKLNKTLAAVIASAGLGLAGQAMAAGTAAGTSITNTVTLGYTVNSVDQTLDSDVSFLVDNKVDLAVVAQDTATIKVIPNGPSTGAFYVAKFLVQNDGNLAQGYSFTVSDAASGTTNTGPDVTDTSDTATTSAFKVYVDSTTGGTVGTFDAADTATTIASLAPDASVNVFVVIDDAATVATSLVDGDIAVVSLEATTLVANSATVQDENHEDAFNKDAVQVVFADTGNDGKEADTTAFEIETAKFTDPNDPNSAAVLSVDAINDPICKGSTVAAADNTDYSFGSTNKCLDLDGDNSTDYLPKAIPGAQVQFTYEAKNTGSVATTATTFSKTLGAEYTADTLANVVATINGTAVAASDITVSSNTVSVDLGAVAVNDEINITFTAIVK